MTGTSVAHHILNDDKKHGDQEPAGGSSGGKGPSVVMLEAREACWGATGRNGGHCQPLLFEHPHDPSIAHFELANFHTLQSLISTKGIDCEFVPQPGVRAIYDSSHVTDVELALLTLQETAPELGKMMRIVTDKTELEALRIPTAVGAVVTSVAARMWPYKFVSRILEDLLTSAGLKGTFNLQTLTPVENVEQHGERWSVKTSRGSITTSRVVLATNAYTSHLLPSFADLIVPCRGQMSALTPLPSVAGEKRLKTSFGFLGDGLDDYLIQRSNERGGHLMFGGGRQHGPSIGTTDDSTIDEKTAEYLRSRLVDALGLPEGKVEKHQSIKCDRCIARKVRCIRTTALKPCVQCQRHFQPCTNSSASDPNTEGPKSFEATHEWTGIMGFSRDDHPWVGPVPDTRNLYIAAGYTGHGMPNTWLCGKAVALMVTKSLGPYAPRPMSKSTDRLISDVHKYPPPKGDGAEPIISGLSASSHYFPALLPGIRDCLAGCTVAFTGDLEQMSREDAQSLVKDLGGEVTHWPSKNTTYVVVGAEPGMKKMESVALHGLQSINERDWENLIQARINASRMQRNNPAHVYETIMIASAAEEVGLPKSYLVSKERILQAMEIEDVEAKDWAEMDRGRRREQADRPPSGYA